MFEAKEVHNWNHTAALMTHITNSFKSKDDPAVHLDDLHPYFESAVLKKPGKAFEHLRGIVNGNGRSN